MKLWRYILCLTLVLGFCFSNPVTNNVSAPPIVFVNPASTTPATTLLLDETGLGSAAAAYSVRKLRSAYSGSCLRVRRSSDSTEQDIGFVSNTLDTASMESFCGAGDGFVVKWYDQSGNARDILNATAANQPKIVSSGVTLIGPNSKPTIRFDGSNDSLAASTFTLNQPITHCLIFNNVSWSDPRRVFDGGSNDSGSFLQHPSGTTMSFYAGSSFISAGAYGTATWNLSTIIFNGASSSARKNADSPATGNPGSANPGGVTLAAKADNSTFSNIEVSEWVVWPSSLSSDSQTTARSSINTFFALY